jgi:hypothetical protein
MSSNSTQSCSRSLEHSASEIVLQLLGELQPVGSELREIVEKGCLRSLDARTIIEWTISGESAQNNAAISRTIIPSRFIAATENQFEKIELEGLAPHFREMLSHFGAIFLDLCGNENQRRSAEKWSSAGERGVFLMTDAGGAVLANWLSVLKEESGRKDLVIDKIDSIEGHTAHFAIVAARRGHSPLPIFFLLPPEQLASLRREAVGASWLDGSFRLANVVGRVEVNAECILAAGGLSTASLFLTIVRPRFVRALLAYLNWLERFRRIVRTGPQQAASRNLKIIAETASARNRFSGSTIDEVSAIKFASNELILDIVTSASVTDARDRRDLLGFTKMEGSSYRCLFEVLEKRRKRHGKSWP